MGAIERILLIQLRQLGDILLTTPALRELRLIYPKAEISILTHAMGKLVLTGNPNLDHHYTYREEDSVRTHLKLIRELRNQKFEVVFDFMNNPRSAFLARATGCPRRVGFKSQRSFFYTEKFRPPPDDKYIVERKFDLLRFAGIHPQSVSLDLPWSETDFKKTREFLGNHSSFAESQLRVALSPTHRRVQRKWSLDRYIELGRRLVKEKSASIVWLWGTADEEKEIDEMIARCDYPTIKIPKTTFQEMAALLSQIDLFIGNSNGPSHVAVAAGCCSVQLHGHTNGASWCPPTSKHRYCQSDQFGIPGATLESISLEEVWEKFLSLEPELVARRNERKNALSSQKEVN